MIRIREEDGEKQRKLNANLDEGGEETVDVEDKVETKTASGDKADDLAKACLDVVLSEGTKVRLCDGVNENDALGPHLLDFQFKLVLQLQDGLVQSQCQVCRVQLQMILAEAVISIEDMLELSVRSRGRQ